jgi:hypothetical protein
VKRDSTQTILSLAGPMKTSVLWAIVASVCCDCGKQKPMAARRLRDLAQNLNLII